MIVNVAELDPEGTLTEAGAVSGGAALREKDSVADVELARVNLQVALEALPIVGVPATAGKVQVKEDREAAGTMVRDAVWVTPLYEAVIKAD